MTDEQREQLEEYKQAFLNRLDDENKTIERLHAYIRQLENELLRYASNC